MYKERREKIKKFALGTLIVNAHTQMQLVGDMAGVFLQEVNFLWLSGIKEPDWRLIIAGSKSYLIAPQIDEVHEIFDGSLSHENAKKVSGVDEVLSYEEGEKLLRELAGKYEVASTLGKDPHEKYYGFVMNPAQERLRKKLKKLFREVHDIRPELNKLRAIKSNEEIAEIQAAINLTAKTFREVRSKLGNGKDFAYEYQIEAEFNKAFRETGAEGHAYQPIVAGGKNACTLHYIKNNDPLPNNGLVLLDIGARVNGYAADVTRTYAVGQPTQRQKDVHAEVEKAHHEIIDLIKPGVKFRDYSDQVDEIMKRSLKNLNLLESEDDYRKYFPHAISHGLGIDVHDTLGGHKEFRPGMVLTVEPGIYIPEEGIGVRIEDDILVTETGSRTLSADLPTGL